MSRIISHRPETYTQGIHPVSTPHQGTLSITQKVLMEDGRQLFLKQLKPEYATNPDYRLAFHKEFETGQRLDSPYIVHYRKWKEKEDGTQYILMDSVEGDTLRQRLDDNPEWFADHQHLGKFLDQLLEGLTYMHDHQVVHLDLKPDNIMLTQVNDDVRIIDLGCCFTDNYPTSYGCSDRYRAPEVGTLQQNITHSADIYSIGCILQDISDAIKTANPKEKRLIRQLDSLASECLSDDPAQRPTSDRLLSKVKHISYKRPLYKTISYILLPIVFILLLAGHFFVNNYDFKDNGLYYNVLNEDSLTCEVTNRRGIFRKQYTDNVSIPATVEHNGKTYHVVSIAEGVFIYNKRLLAVEFHEGLRYIGSAAFAGCDSLVVVTLPESLDSIGFSCFYVCKNLCYIRLPHKMKSLPQASLAGTHLNTITLPEGLETLERDVFAGDSSLVSVTMPSTLKTIDRGVFWNCASLREITIPASVEHIGEYAFYGCRSMQTVTNLNPIPQEISPIFRKGFNPKAVIRVPAASVESYRKATYWKDQKIEAIRQPEEE